jgi:hypothetical protein
MILNRHNIFEETASLAVDRNFVKLRHDHLMSPNP